MSKFVSFFLKYRCQKVWSWRIVSVSAATQTKCKRKLGVHYSFNTFAKHWNEWHGCCLRHMRSTAYGQAQQHRRTYRIEGNQMQTEMRSKREREELSKRPQPNQTTVQLRVNCVLCVSLFLWSSLLALSLFTLCAKCGNTCFAIIWCVHHLHLHLYPLFSLRWARCDLSFDEWSWTSMCLPIDSCVDDLKIMRKNLYKNAKLRFSSISLVGRSLAARHYYPGAQTTTLAILISLDLI